MQRNARIYVAGHRGMVGSAILRRLEAEGYTSLLRRTHAELDLTRQEAVEQFFAADEPEYAFDAAAKVACILGNSPYPAAFFVTNLSIRSRLIHTPLEGDARKTCLLES